MSKILARQWLIFVCCFFASLIYEIIVYQNSQEKSLLNPILGTPFFSLILFFITVPIQLTIWALKKHGFKFKLHPEISMLLGDYSDPEAITTYLAKKTKKIQEDNPHLK